MRFRCRTVRRPTRKDTLVSPSGRQPWRRGFSLVELLVVISILAILAAILFPVFASVRARARSTVCLSNLSQLGKAYQMYLVDFDERFPNWYMGYVPPRPEPFGSLTFWPEFLQLYVRDDAIYSDPAFRWHV